MGQEIKIDSCGVENSNILNRYEAEYFNRSMKNQRFPTTFDFYGKKIGFFFDIARFPISKKEYFDRWGKEYYENQSGVVNQLIVLNKIEKAESGGYDAIIVSWSKFKVTKGQKKKMIKKLKQNKSS